MLHVAFLHEWHLQMGSFDAACIILRLKLWTQEMFLVNIEANSALVSKNKQYYVFALDKAFVFYSCNSKSRCRIRCAVLLLRLLRLKPDLNQQVRDAWTGHVWEANGTGRCMQLGSFALRAFGCPNAVPGLFTLVALKQQAGARNSPRWQ